MNILRLIEKKFIRLLLIVFLFPLQSCSNTVIGEKLENSFDINEKLKTSEKTNNPRKANELPKIKSRKKDDKSEKAKEKGNGLADITMKNSSSNKDSLNQKSTKSIKKKNFNPQPYRIILRLSGANPSAPAETVTEALRKAGVQFEVEKIERFDEGDLSNDTSKKR